MPWFSVFFLFLVKMIATITYYLQGCNVTVISTGKFGFAVGGFTIL